MKVNRCLHRGKHKAEVELCNERAKKEKVEMKLRDVTNEEKSTSIQLCRANKAL